MVATGRVRGVSEGLGSHAGRSLMEPGEELAPLCDFLLQSSRILGSSASSVLSALQVAQSQDANGSGSCLSPHLLIVIAGCCII